MNGLVKLMAAKEILITEFMDEEAVHRLAAQFHVSYQPQLVDSRQDLLQACGEYQALIVRNRTQVNAELLTQAAKLKVIGRLGVGLDNIDVSACEKRGITVIPASGANARAVAEYVIASALMLLRGAFGSTEAVVKGEWPRTALSNGREMAGKSLGLIGMGATGQEVARLGQALGMRIQGYDPFMASDNFPKFVERFSDLDEMLKQCHIISLHMPLTHQTKNLLDERRLGLLLPHSIVINASRGGVLDESALVKFLRQGRLAGAALDVFADEPLGKESHFVDCPNLILTPHIAGLTVESNLRVSSMIAEKVAAALQGVSS